MGDNHLFLLFFPNQKTILIGRNFYVSIDDIYQFEFQRGIYLTLELKFWLALNKR